MRRPRGGTGSLRMAVKLCLHNALCRLGGWNSRCDRPVVISPGVYRVPFDESGAAEAKGRAAGLECSGEGSRLS